MKRFPRRMGSEEGSSLVETALTILILYTFIFGILEFSFALYTSHVLAELSREGTRYAIVRGASCTSFTTACPATTTDIQNYVLQRGFPGINQSKLAVNVTFAAYPSGTSCALMACNGPGNLVTVTATYAFPLMIPFAPSVTLNLTNTSAMIISQ